MVPGCQPDWKPKSGFMFWGDFVPFVKLNADGVNVMLSPLRCAINIYVTMKSKSEKLAKKYEGSGF